MFKVNNKDTILVAYFTTCSSVCIVEMFCKKICCERTHIRQSSFLVKIEIVKNKKFRHRCFPVKHGFFRATFPQNSWERLLLISYESPSPPTSKYRSVQIIFMTLIFLQS